MPRSIELWSNLTTAEVGNHGAVVDRAVLLETDGWDGGTLVDSQCLRSDVFVALASCAHATSRLKLGTGTGNPATRHPSVIASAAAALQIVSKERMVYGIGRGDSALAYIGASPVSVAFFERAIEMIQAYLRGAAVPIAEAASMLAGAPKGFEHLALAAAPTESSLKWLPKDIAKTPLEVSCTGPKVIGVAARHAEYISLAVGADVERLKWGLGVAREEIERAGRDPAEVRFGAYLPLYPHTDIHVSRTLAQGMVASQGRFAVINKKVAGEVTDRQRAVLERVANSYDMTNHGSAISSQVKALDAEFIDGFALVGDPARCVDRIKEIIELGVERLHLWTPAIATREGRESYQLSVEKVLPELL
jgi:5,10-methylenetetrahydromethanopterin reductase